MAPKKAKDDGGEKKDKPLPLRTDKVEKMRNPTARLGPGQESNRGGSSAPKEMKKGQISNRGGKAKSNADGQVSHRGGKQASPPKDAQHKKSLAKVPETGLTGGGGPGASSSAAAPTKPLASEAGPLGKKKIDYLTEEMMCASEHIHN